MRITRDPKSQNNHQKLILSGALGPGFSKHHLLNKVVSQGFVKFSSTHKIKLSIFFALKMRAAFAVQKLFTLFQQKMAIFCV